MIFIHSIFPQQCLQVVGCLCFRLLDNEQKAVILQQERELYSSQAQTLQQSLSQLTVDKQLTEAELKVKHCDSAAVWVRVMFL